MILLFIVGWPVAVQIYIFFKHFVHDGDGIIFLKDLDDFIVKSRENDGILGVLITISTIIGWIIGWFVKALVSFLFLGIIFIIYFFLSLIEILILINPRPRHYRKVLVNKKPMSGS